MTRVTDAQHMPTTFPAPTREAEQILGTSPRVPPVLRTDSEAIRSMIATPQELLRAKSDPKLEESLARKEAQLREYLANPGKFLPRDLRGLGLPGIPQRRETGVSLL